MRLLPPLFTARSAVPTMVFTKVANEIMPDSNDLNPINSPQAPYPILTDSPLSKVDTKALAEELGALYKGVMDSLDKTDAQYIKRIYAAVVYTELAARGLLAVSGKIQSRRYRLGAWLLGVGLLSTSKILNNMELGHNVMHGQYDWMQHPHLNSQKFDWDIVCPAPLWQHSHNYLHHTFTNIVGRDHDVGYHLIRVTDEQTWTPSDRYNPLKTLILALGFEWAVAFHDIQISVDEYAHAANKQTILQSKSRDLFAKIIRQVGKDYIALPTAAGLALGQRSATMTLSGNLTANIVRNLWTWAIIFCGHLTEQAHIYTHLNENETRGDWYVRQILGSSNIKGSRLFHILTGNLSHQIEHHIFPDMPAHRYASISPQVQDICQKYGIAYNTGSFGKQFRQVLVRIYHFSKPSEIEHHAYQQAQMADNNSVTLTNGSVESVEQDPALQNSGFGNRLTKYLPPVVRQAFYYARYKETISI